MKKYLHFHLFLILYSYCSGQGLIPQDLYDAGINLGYLEIHSERGVAADTWSTWASNAGNEFSSAWGLSSVSIPQPPFPSGSFTVRNNMVQYMMSNASGQCLSPWFQASLNIFNAGFNMGRAFALTNYTCTGCVQTALYNYANNLESIGRLNIPNKETFLSVSGDARAVAQGLNGITTNSEAREALTGVANDVQGNIVDINSILPNSIQPCNSLGSISPVSADMSRWKVDYGKFTPSPSKIEAMPTGDGRTSYYISPQEMHGNWSRFQYLIFDKRSWGGTYYGPDKYAAYGDVIIKNGTKSARYDIKADHSKNWVSFEIPLYNDGNWKLSRGATLSDVLRNVTEFKIRAEYGGGKDFSTLRGVRLE